MSQVTSLAIRAKTKGNMEFFTRQWDDEPQGNELFLRTTYTMVSPGTEMSRILDTHTRPLGFPCMTGYLAEGIVEAAGPDAENVKKGDYVLYGSHLANINIPEDDVMVITEDVRGGSACFAKLMAIPLRGVRNAKVHIGETVIVFGLGPIGLFASMFAKTDGAVTVIGVDPIEYRRDIAEELGCDITLDPGEDDINKVVEGLPRGGAEVVIDATGTTTVIGDSFQYAADFGRVLVLGGIHGKVEMDLYTNFQKSNLTMIGSGTNRPTDYPFNQGSAEIRAILNMLETEMIDPYSALTYVPVGKALEAYNHLIKRDEDVITYCFDWSDQEKVMKEHDLI